MKRHRFFRGAQSRRTAPCLSYSLALFPLKSLAFFIAAGALCATAFAQTNQWTWMGGSALSNQPSVYGTQGVAATGNIPGATVGGTGWVDSAGNFWLLAGNDLWMFDPQLQEWAWIKGSAGKSLNGVYGSLGVPAAGNMPGARSNGLSWTDSQGNLWLFGGIGTDANGGSSQLNDFWEYSPATGQWTWIAGNSTVITCGISGNQMHPIYCPHHGTYGTLGQPDPGNLPGARQSAVVWTDKDGNFWTFGGIGAIEPQIAKVVNELWKYIPSTGAWGWMGGCSSTPLTDPCPTGIYGTLGTPAGGNIPGARFGAAGWTDSGGNLWLFGGAGYDSESNQGILNDLWRFDPSRMQWTWMGGARKLTCSTNTNGGSACTGQSGIYGQEGVASSANYPGARNSAMAWTDTAGNFWLFGGNGYDAAGTLGELNDLWVFSPVTLQWAWMAGSSTIGCAPIYGTVYCGKPGVYGQLGIADPGNTPGGRDSSVGWTGSDSSFWLFGGMGYDSVGRTGGAANGLNDVWEYRPQAPGFSVAAPTFSIPGGTYTSTQTVALADAAQGATIYYTTDGSVPTSNSTAYAAPLVVSATETVQAIAIVPGFSPSDVASATYVIHAPETFTFSSSANSMTVNSGTSGILTLTVTPQNGFHSAVNFACSGLPTGASCSFNPATVTPSGSAAATTMTISTAKKSASVMQVERLGMPIAAFAIMVGMLRIRRTRLRGLVLLIAVAMAGLGFLSACGGGGATSGGGGGSNPVMYTTTVTATSGSLSQAVTIAVTVN